MDKKTITELHVDLQLLESAFMDDKINSYEYTFIKEKYVSEQFTYGLSEKQTALLEQVFPKLHPNTFYTKEVAAPTECVYESNYSYSYKYTYEPSEEEQQLEQDLNDKVTRRDG